VVGTLSIVAYIFAAALIKRFFPSEESPVWAKKIHANLCRREADYKKDGDEIRYQAIKSLKEDFQVRFEREILDPQR
jgi:hypothetical protein